MSSKRYTEEFKLEAIKQITERGYSIQDVNWLSFVLAVFCLTESE